jgi:hypothetical protein
MQNKSQRVVEIIDDEYFKTEGAYYERCEGQMEDHHGTEGFVGFVPVPAIVKYLKYIGKYNTYIVVNIVLVYFLTRLF